MFRKEDNFQDFLFASLESKDLKMESALKEFAPKVVKKEFAPKVVRKESAPKVVRKEFAPKEVNSIL